MPVLDPAMIAQFLRAPEMTLTQSFRDAAADLIDGLRNQISDMSQPLPPKDDKAPDDAPHPATLLRTLGLNIGIAQAQAAHVHGKDREAQRTIIDLLMVLIDERNDNVG